MFTIVFTRPDIAFVIGKLSQYISDLVEYYSHALKNLIRYLQLTITQKIRYGPGGDISTLLYTLTLIGLEIELIGRAYLEVLLYSIEDLSLG